MSDEQSLAEQFEADRGHLRAVAYRLLGSMHDADDAVQAAWLKVSRAGSADLRNPTGWFTTVTARECLDQLRAKKRRGEVLGGDERVTSPAFSTSPAPEEEVALAESVGRALMVVLDRLSPAQRVAFVLHDMFAIPFDDIGHLLDRSPAAAKKLASRARERVEGTVSTRRTRRRSQSRCSSPLRVERRGPARPGGASCRYAPARGPEGAAPTVRWTPAWTGGERTTSKRPARCGWVPNTTATGRGPPK